MMDPGSPEYKAFFAEIAKSYNDDVALENLHRENLFRHIIACIIWIVASILGVWGVIDFGKDPIWVTVVGVMIILILLTTLYCIHKKHQRNVRQLLHARQAALLWKDGKLP
jgi:membrane protein YdbS with pleckstrin-like domain